MLTFNWCNESAEQDHAMAQHLLSKMYYFGEGTTEDKAKAFYWCEKSAEKDCAEAQFDLGTMYLRGDGVVANKEQADYWTKKSYENGYETAKDILKEERYNREIENIVFDDMLKPQGS